MICSLWAWITVLGLCSRRISPVHGNHHTKLNCHCQLKCLLFFFCCKHLLLWCSNTRIKLAYRLYRATSLLQLISGLQHFKMSYYIIFTRGGKAGQIIKIIMLQVCYKFITITKYLPPWTLQKCCLQECSYGKLFIYPIICKCYIYCSFRHIQVINCLLTFSTLLINKGLMNIKCTYVWQTASHLLSYTIHIKNNNSAQTIFW